MADFSPTAEQRDAITARNASLLISAGAGSGKTRVLTERLMSYLTDESSDCSVTDFLIITYTRAAAAELRSRILSAINGALSKNPKNRRLRRQAALVHHAEIDTIHSFCGRLARENAHLLGIPPDFRIAEETECASVKLSVMTNLLEARYDKMSEHDGFEQLVNTLSPGLDDRRLVEVALDIYDKLRSHSDGRLWIKSQLERLSPGTVINVAETPWGALLIEKAAGIARYRTSKIRSALDEISCDQSAVRALGECFASAEDQLQRFLDAQSAGWDALMEAAQFTFPRAKPLKGSDYDGIKSVWKACRSELREISDIFVAKESELIGDMNAVYPVTKALFELVLDFTELYGEEKNRRHIADFSDLEHFALKLLTETGGESSAAAVISGRYREIMIDEYQDVSAIQERIFSAISNGGKNLVMVGDVRQSIYRFRLAEPSIFLGKYRSFSDKSDSPERRIILADNFRSRKNILDAVNYVFHGIMSEHLGEMEYTEREFLKAGKIDSSPDIPVELRILAPDEAYSDAPDRHTLEADYVAQRILEFVSSGFEIPDGGGTRPASFSDFAILMRSKTYAHLFRDALSARGIPVETDESDSLLDTYEVRIALAFLYVVDNPRNDIQLISVLRSPVYGFSPDELAEARLLLRDGEFYEALQLYAEKSEKAQLFLAHLQEFRALAPELLADGLLLHIYNRTNLPALMAAYPDGETRRLNLSQLVSEARNADGFGYSGVFEFLRFLERMREPVGCISSRSPGGVRIMSVHKSKGLEFPVVFIVDLAHRFNTQDTKKRMLFHPELGPGPKLVDLERRIEYPTLPRLAISEKLMSETLAEELRVLYVAMTRAEEKLIMVYSDLKPEQTLEKLRESAQYPVSPYVLSRQTSLGNMLLLALLSHPGAAGLFDDAPKDGLFDMRLVRTEPRKQPYEPLTEAPAATETPHIAAPELIYAYPAAPALPSKLTVTELKNRFYDAELSEEAENTLVSQRFSEYEKPRFVAGDSRIAGAVLGNAIHTAMRHIPLRRHASISDVAHEIGALSARGILSEAERSAVDAGAIFDFFTSKLGSRVISADEVFREFKFSLLVPAEEFFPGGGEDEILFQGVVDLAFREGGAITVVDFKTDRLRFEDALSEKIALYTPQVRAYMHALGRVTGLPVSEGYIYFFDGATSVSV